MKIYRVNYQTKKELKNNGYAFFASKGAATTAKRAVEGCKGSIDILELDKSKDGIINFLNTYANHSKES